MSCYDSKKNEFYIKFLSFSFKLFANLVCICNFILNNPAVNEHVLFEEVMTSFLVEIDLVELHSIHT